MLDEQGSNSLGDPLANLGRLAKAVGHSPTRDRRPVAQKRVPSVLEVEEPAEMAGEAEASQEGP